MESEGNEDDVSKVGNLKEHLRERNERSTENSHQQKEGFEQRENTENATLASQSFLNELVKQLINKNTLLLSMLGEDFDWSKM